MPFMNFKIVSAKNKKIKLKIQEKNMILTCLLMFSPEFNLEWELCKTSVLSWIQT